MGIRVIARLDVKGGNLVKGIHLEGLRVLGRPEVFADFYYQNGVDEIICMDIVASLYGRNSLLDVIERIATRTFVPLCVGGGLRTLDDIRAVLRAGADKVAINTAALRQNGFLKSAVSTFGSSTIVVAIEAIKQPDGRYSCFTDCGREETGIDAFEWARRAAELGAGELLVTSVDREGTGRGFDLALVRGISDEIGIPVIAHGGAGCIDHIVDAVTAGHADAICLASMLHYDAVRKVSIDVSALGDQGNLEFLRARREQGFKKVKDASLDEIKDAMRSRQLEVRIA